MSSELTYYLLISACMTYRMSIKELFFPLFSIEAVYVNHFVPLSGFMSVKISVNDLYLKNAAKYRNLVNEVDAVF